MRKLCTCLFYGLCVFTIVFSLFWMALPKLSLPVPDPGSEVLVTVTGIYTNLLPENDAVRIKRGVTVYSERELDLLLEDLGD